MHYFYHPSVEHNRRWEKLAKELGPYLKRYRSQAFLEEEHQGVRAGRKGLALGPRRRELAQGNGPILEHMGRH
jgi:hypothetical protein